MSRSRTSPGRPSRSSLTATLVAGIVLLAGAMNIYSAWFGIQQQRLTQVRALLPLEINQGSRTLTALAGVLLMLLSWSIFRRKRPGWVAAVILLALSLILHLMKGLNYGEAIFSALVLGILLGARQEFVVRSDPRSINGAVVMSLLAAAGSLLYGVLGFALLRHQFTPAYTPGRAFQSTFALVVQTDAPILKPRMVPYPVIHNRLIQRLSRLRPHARPHHDLHPDWDALWFTDSLIVISWVSALFIAWMLLRPVAASLHFLDHEREEVRRLLCRAGGPSLAYWTLLPGLQYLFSADHRAVIPYRVIDNIALVLGDPLGYPEAIPTVIEAFDQLCMTNDWHPTWYQTTGHWLPQFRAHGWSGMKLGEDAILDLPSLSLTGKAWQDIRTAQNRLPREGYAACWYDLTTDPAGWLPALNEISREWLATQHGEEKSFSLGTWQFAQSFSREQRFLVLHDKQLQPVAFLSFVPIFGSPWGWSLDLMRRKKDIPPGSMEFLLATALERFRGENAEIVSLGLSPLSDVTPEDAVHTPELLERIRGLVVEHFSRLYNFQGLLRFKAKFHPRWEARYLIYPSLPYLPKVLFALMRAHSPHHQRIIPTPALGTAGFIHMPASPGGYADLPSSPYSAEAEQWEEPADAE